MLVVDHLEEVICGLNVDELWAGGLGQAAVVCALYEQRRRSYFCRDDAYLELLWRAERRGVLRGLRLEGRQVARWLPTHRDGWPGDWRRLGRR